jgi:DNA-binding GntR family transcriptional regulator
MTTQTALLRFNLHEMLVSAIREMIVSGELRPGDKIPEQELCRRFEVSRTPLREALKVLASEGMLQLLPRRGAIVARISPEEINELFPIMAALEALAGELVCKRVTTEELSELQDIHDRMLRNHAAGDEPAYLQANRQFHETLVRFAANATLQSCYLQILTRTRAFRFVARKSSENWRIAVEDHCQIMEALHKRNTRLLSRLLRRHVLGVTVKIARDALSGETGSAHMSLKNISASNLD